MLKIQFYLKNKTIKNHDSYLYIATNIKYAKKNIFKVGITRDLKKRLSGYQTSQIKEDSYYYCYTFKCYNSKMVEERITGLLSEFREQSNKELYILDYQTLFNIVNMVCHNYDYEVNMSNEIVKNLNTIVLKNKNIIPLKISNYDTVYNNHEEYIAKRYDINEYKVTKKTALNETIYQSYIKTKLEECVPCTKCENCINKIDCFKNRISLKDLWCNFEECHTNKNDKISEREFNQELKNNFKNTYKKLRVNGIPKYGFILLKIKD
jgi:hypothetical protein